MQKWCRMLAHNRPLSLCTRMGWETMVSNGASFSKYHSALLKLTTSNHSSNEPCPDGRYGVNCNQQCKCKHGKCRADDGFCICEPGFKGI